MKFNIYLFAPRIFALFLTLACSSPPPAVDPCATRRTAIDIGQNSISALTAQIDSCKNRITTKLYSAQVPFEKNDQNLQSAAQNTIDGESIQNEVLTTLKKIVNIAKNVHQSRSFVAVVRKEVAEAPFWPNLKAKIKRELSINVIALDSALLGEIMLYSTQVDLKLKNRKFILWNIDPNQTQWISGPTEKKKIVNYSEPYGFQNFFEEVLKQKKITNLSGSPNPMNLKEIKAALDSAQSISSQWQLPEEVKSKLSKPDVMVIGIGSFFNNQIRRAMATNEDLTESQIESLIRSHADLPDRAEDDSPATHYENTNLIFVAGLMKAFAIPKLKIAQPAIPTGLLLHSKFWTASER